MATFIEYMEPEGCGECEYINYLSSSITELKNIVLKYYKEFTQNEDAVFNDIITLNEEAAEGVNAEDVRRRFHNELLKCDYLKEDIYIVDKDLLFEYYPFKTDLTEIPNEEIIYSPYIKPFDDNKIHVITDKVYFRYVKHNMTVHAFEVIWSDELLNYVQTPELRLKILLHDNYKFTNYEDMFMLYSTVVYKNRIYTYLC